MLDCSTSPWTRCSCSCPRLLIAEHIVMFRNYSYSRCACCCLSTDLISSALLPLSVLFWSPPPAARGRSRFWPHKQDPSDNDDGNDDGNGDVGDAADDDGDLQKGKERCKWECSYSKWTTTCGYFVCDSVPVCGNRSLKYGKPICILKCPYSACLFLNAGKIIARDLGKCLWKGKKVFSTLP